MSSVQNFGAEAQMSFLQNVLSGKEREETTVFVGYTL